MSISIVAITLNIKNNRNYPTRINVLGSPLNLLDTTNSKTEYRWDITGITFSASCPVTLEYQAEGGASFATYTYELTNGNNNTLAEALNGLGIGYFNVYTELGQTYISTYNDNYVFNQLTVCNASTTSTTTSTTTAALTSTTTSTTTAAPTTSTTTSTTTAALTSTTTSTTTAAPTTSTTTSTTTAALTSTTTSTTTAAPTTSTTTSTTTAALTSTTTSTTTAAPTTSTTTTSTTAAPALYLASSSVNACSQTGGQLLTNVSFTGSSPYCNYTTLNSTEIPSLPDGTYFVSDGTNVRAWTKTSTPSNLYNPTVCSSCGLTTSTTTTTTTAGSLATIAFDFFDDGSGIISARATVTSGTTIDSIGFNGSANGYQSLGCSGTQLTNSFSDVLPSGGTGTTISTEVFGSISAILSAQAAPLFFNGTTITQVSQDITVGGNIYTITGGTNCFSPLL
jgi:hypothetical protein